MDIKEKIKKWKEKLSKNIVLKDEILEEVLSVFALNIYEKINYRGVLFYGPPGTGKTLLMKEMEKVLKKELGENFRIVKIAGPEILSEYYGKSERNLRNRFREAEEIGDKFGIGIVYIEEIDSIAPRRDMVRGELEPRLVGQLLTLMDGIRENSKVFVVASTNRIDILDPALRRPGRFDHEIEFDIPDTDLIEKIIELYAGRFGIDNMLKEDLIKRADRMRGFTPTDIMHLVREAWREQIVGDRIDLDSILRRITPSGLRGFVVLRKEDIKEEEEKEPAEKIERVSSDEGAKKIFAYLFRRGEIEGVVECNCVRFISKYPGETEMNVREFFRKVKRFSKYAVWIRNCGILKDFPGAWVELQEGLESLKEEDVYIVVNSTRLQSL